MQEIRFVRTVALGSLGTHSFKKFGIMNSCQCGCSKDDIDIQSRQLLSALGSAGESKLLTTDQAAVHIFELGESCEEDAFSSVWAGRQSSSGQSSRFRLAVGYKHRCGFEQVNYIYAVADVAAAGADLAEMTLALYTKVSANKHHLTELQNAQQEYHHSINRRLGLLEKQIWRIALWPADCCVQRKVPAVAAAVTKGNENNEEDDMPPFVVILCKWPHELHVLWQEYKLVLVGGRKEVKNFSPAEYGKVKVVFAKCKFVWNTISGMVRAGYTAQMVMGEIDDIYGQISVTETIKNKRG
eukprot:14704177-Ditylum_brightwellii.AAC.1